MGRVTTNNTELSFAPETELGKVPVAPGTPWTLTEPNDITAIGAEITTTPRNPISPTRQRRKGAVTDLDSTLEFEHDTTYGLLEEFVPPFAFAQRTNDDLTKTITAVSGTAVTVSDFPTTGGRVGQNALYHVEGLPTVGNNGLKVRNNTAVTATSVALAGLTAEPSIPARANPKIRYAGQRVSGATVGAVDTDKGTTSITTLTGADTWGLTVGQMIAITQQNVQSNASTAWQNVLYGRVLTISATEITLDKASLVSDLSTPVRPTGAVDILFGGLVRNLPATSSEYLERSYTFEAVWNNLETPNTPGAARADGYEYSKGNYCNSIAISLPGQALSTCTVGFVGTDTEPPKAAREQNATTKLPAPRTAAVNTTSDIARLRIDNIDGTGLTTDFDSLTLTINNNVTPEKVLAQLGGKFVNLGNFEVDLETDVIFSSSGVISAVRNNKDTSMDFILLGEQGAICFDMPKMTLGLSGRNLPRDESVTLSTTGASFGDDRFNPPHGTSLHVSFIPFVPMPATC